MFEDVEIRYHFPEQVKLRPDEPVIIEKLLTGGSEFVPYGNAPDDTRDMESIRTFVRDIALTYGGEAWRATTERGELLCTYSVYDLADELNGKPIITLHPRDQFCLAVARTRMGV